VLLLDDGSGGTDDTQLESIAHGVIVLQQHVSDYGPTRRRLLIRKIRGQPYAEGYHDFAIRSGGLTVYPRLIASHRKSTPDPQSLPSGVAALDSLTGGGLDLGSSVLLLGPSGAGKSMLAGQYALAAAGQGQRVRAYLFEEGVESFFKRAESLGMDLRPHRDRGLVEIERIDPASLSLGEFTCRIREAVEARETKVVVIDSINGYLNAMPSDRILLVQMHELLTYLNQNGVLTILILAQHGLVGEPEAQVDLSYLADTVILLQYFEAAGAIRQAISVIKKRTGAHERTIRELNVDTSGLRIGNPLRDFRGVLTGAPEYKGSEPLFEVGKP